MKFRKVLFSGVALAFALAAVLILPVRKANAFSTVLQYGVVVGEVTHGGNAVVGANVSVSCNSFTLTTTTNGTGVYTVQFGNSQCLVGQTVTVNATSGSLNGSNSGLMDNGSSFGGIKVDVAVVNVPLVPEFGLITGAFAALTSGGLFMIKRRKA